MPVGMMVPFLLNINLDCGYHSVYVKPDSGLTKEVLLSFLGWARQINYVVFDLSEIGPVD